MSHLSEWKTREHNPQRDRDTEEKRETETEREEGDGVRAGAGPGRQGQVWDPAFGIVKL